MNIIIPIGGLGERFSQEGYLRPKPLLYSRGRPMIYWVIDSLTRKEDDLLIITYTSTLDSYRFRDIINREIKNVLFISIPFQTRSVTETLLYTIKNIPPDRLNYKTVTLDCDTFYTSDILSVVRKSSTNSILYKTDKNIKPIYSYIKLDDQDRIIDIREKYKISDNANIGTYIFSDVNIIKKYCDRLHNNNNNKEMYISHLYDEMIKDGIVVYGVKFEDVTCIGTPMQLKIFGSEKIDERPIRFCFDLDNTLVTFPKKENDYSSVEPVCHNINFLRFIKSLGHIIIIHTARRMRTHGGNNGKVLADIGRITFDTLDKFNIPFDEIYFGKPEAEFYIDDKAINCYNNLERETGFYNLSFKERSFNTITKSEDTIVKTSSDPKLLGEIYWYNNIPSGIKYLFPNFHSQLSETDKTSYTIDKIRGIPISHMYTNNNLTCDTFNKLLGHIGEIHQSSLTDEYVDIYSLYIDKLNQRYHSFNYSKFDRTEEIYNVLVQKYNSYKNNKMARLGVIHGDPVFSNIIIDELSQIKFVDMRGVQGTKLTIYGDIFYDYSKIYQSLLGYEYILSEYPLQHIYINSMVDIFKNYFISKFSEDEWKYLQYLTIGLYFTLIPLHDEYFQNPLYNHMIQVFDSL